MANTSKIEWTDSTFNPWIGCTKVSPACDHCYAAVSTPSRTLGIEWGSGKPRHRTSAANWRQPALWNARTFAQCADCGWRGEWPNTDAGSRGACPACNEGALVYARRRVFCASLADVFDNEVDPQWRADLFALIRATPNLDWLLLTKRIGNAHQMIGESLIRISGGTDLLPSWPWLNVWLGATVCNQTEADRDIPKLLAAPAAVRFLSIEPMLGPIDIRWLITEPTGNTRTRHGKRQMELRSTGLLHWVIAGGESGTHARPMNPNHVRSLRDQCAAAGVPFLFKQWGNWAPGSCFDSHIPASESCDFDGSLQTDEERMWRVDKAVAGRTLDGVVHDGYPTK